ncbi:MAG TPA: competence/damage-inducible protein A [Cytophagaceae bacterium]|jgi:nicotinamide-nucleotide amidase|nr:competence/damage-inducible protein A [Cytophagaceae bacterium]
MKNIYADIITIGDEILYGQITDTNSQWISAELDKIGILTKRKSSVGDQQSEILEILQESEHRSDIILITGGLGPTNDDITKKTLATYFDCDLVLNADALKDVTDFFERRERLLTETNRSQAFLPSVCTYLPNRSGTAPGMWFEKKDKVFISMPGVPFEMKELMTLQVIPKLKEHFQTPVILHQIVKTIGIGESNLADLLKDWEAQLPQSIKLAYLPSIGEVKLRLTASDENQKQLKSDLQKELEKLKPIIKDYIFSYTDEPIEKIVGDLLRTKKITVAVAESCTGGYLSHLFTSIAGSSDYFKGGVIAYQNEIKTSLLQVHDETLQTYGAVSDSTVREMAISVREKLKSSIGVAVTGIAGPGGGTKEQPVGTIWIGYSDEKKTISKKLLLGSRRDINIRLSAYAVLNMIRLEMSDF